MKAWLFVVLCGCGRIGFDAHGDGGNGDAVGDGPVARCTFQDVDLGRDHTCTIDGDGAVFCWGRNDQGQITGTPGGTKRLPTLVPLPATAVQLAAGRDFTCARVTGDDVYCWGDNSRGQLGIGSTAPQMGPIKVDLGGDTAVTIDAGTWQACAIRASDHSVMCWGENHHFAVGTSTVDEIVSTPAVLAGTQGATGLGLGHRHGCATYLAAPPICWGRGDYGQLGDGNSGDNPPVTATMLSAVAVSAGGRHTCGIDAAGTVRCCGRNGNGELGRGTSDLTGHTDCQPAANGATAISLGVTNTCAIHNGGQLACWGGGDLGPANGTFEVHESVFETPITDAAKLSVGYYHACVIRQGGELVCWGSNPNGELGRGTRSISATPVLASVSGVTAVAVGGFHACAIGGGGTTLSCWGIGTNGQLGTGLHDGSRTPIAVSTGLPMIEGVAAGLFHTCAYGLGVVKCWGDSGNQQTGPNATPPRQLTPVDVPGFAFVADLVAGDATTCARDQGTVKCWGANNHGQLGNNSTTGSAAFVAVNNITAASALCAGAYHECAIDGGVLKCWGINNSGQLGDDSQTERHLPVTVSGVTNPMAIACGNSHTCAIDGTGNVYCWGRNSSGELGLGDYNGPRLTPQLVTLPAPATAITAGFYRTCVKLSTGQAYCWGDGELGELGNGTLGTTETPLESAPLDGAGSITLGRVGGCSVTSGELRCFGDVSMFGNGDNSDAVPMSPSFTCSQ